MTCGLRNALVRLHRGDGGAAAVEFAIVFPVLAMIIFGMWFLGFALYQGGEVRHAVELGSRIYITQSSPTLQNLKDAVNTHLADVPLSSVTVNETSTTTGSSTNAHITWSYQVTTSIPFRSSIPLNFNGTVDVPQATP